MNLILVMSILLFMVLEALKPQIVILISFFISSLGCVASLQEIWREWGT